ncbi:TrmB family transcriptional regulator [Patescibacteria group bacterium]
MALQRFFETMGLDNKSQKVYTALLAIGDAPAAIIAKHAGLKKTTTYHHLEKLVEMGLASSYQHKNSRRFVAENPEKMKSNLEGKIELFEKYLPELQRVAASERNVSLRLYEGTEGYQQIINEELSSREKVVRSMGTYRDLKKVEGGRLSFTDRRIKNKIYSKAIRPENDAFDKKWITDQEKELREVRFFPKGLEVPGMIFVFDDKVTFITPEEEGVGFIITSNSMSKMMKSLFDTMWQVSTQTKETGATS